MLRKCCVIPIVFSLVLSITAVTVRADTWEPGTPEHAVLLKKPLPPEYKDFEWHNAYDFADIRKQFYWEKHKLAFAYGGLATAVGMICLKGLAVVAATEKVVPLLKYLPTWVEPVSEYLLSVSASYGVWLLENECFQGIGPAEEKAKELSSKLGISDYFVFAVVVRHGLLEPWEQKRILPLGANVKFSMSPKEGFPHVLRLKYPRVDFRDMKAHFTERDLSDELRKPTLQRVFAYEVFDGKPIRTAKGHINLRSLPTYRNPKSPLEGEVGGTFHLSVLPEIELGGLREIHLCSPVNQGLLIKKKIDDYVFAVLLDKDTVEVTVPSNGTTPKVGDELEIRVKIRGLHTGKKIVHGSDGRRFSYAEITERVFQGARCIGSGITGTRIENAPNYTVLRCTPRKEGDVTVILQTMHGPAKFHAATVKGEENVLKYIKLKGNIKFEPKAFFDIFFSPITGPDKNIGQGYTTVSQKCSEIIVEFHQYGYFEKNPNAIPYPEEIYGRDYYGPMIKIKFDCHLKVPIKWLGYSRTGEFQWSCHYYAGRDPKSGEFRTFQKKRRLNFYCPEFFGPQVFWDGSKESGHVGVFRVRGVKQKFNLDKGAAYGTMNFYWEQPIFSQMFRLEGKDGHIFPCVELNANWSALEVVERSYMKRSKFESLKRYFKGYWKQNK